MPTRITYNSHSIEVLDTFIKGQEIISYDGKIVSSKATDFGGVHVFSVVEDEENIQYEVEILTNWMGANSGLEIRRQNQTIYSHNG